MFLFHIVSVLAGASLLASASVIKPRADGTNQTFGLYAYGKNITTGLRLFYGNGQAFIGAAAPPWTGQNLNITLTANDDDTTFLAAPDSSDSTNWTTTPRMYIDTSTDAFSPVGFTTNSSLSDGAVTSGFGLYGGWAMHLDDDGTVEMAFYATSTNETDVYLVMWNAATTTPTSGVPISLRTEAPVVIT